MELIWAIPTSMVPLGVVVHHMGTHARLHLQNGSEYLGVHTMTLRRRC